MNPEWRKVGNQTYQLRNIIKVYVHNDDVFVKDISGDIDRFHPKADGYRDALKLYLEVTPKEGEEENGN